MHRGKRLCGSALPNIYFRMSLGLGRAVRPVFFWFFRPHYPTVCYVPMEASPNAALPKLFLYTAFCFPRLIFPPVASVTPDA